MESNDIVYIMYMQDTKTYEFRREFKKDLLARVIADKGDIPTELKIVARFIKGNFNLDVSNLDEMISALPHLK